jgi:sec-independent protein translocase protein TatA
MVLAGGPFGLGPLELGLIVMVLLLLFGATRLADLGGSLGKGIKEFRKNIKEDEDETAASSPPAPSASAGSPPAAPSVSANGGETVSAVKCPSCGNLNPMGSRHCNNCGAGIAAPVS